MGLVPVTKLATAVVQFEIACAGPLQARVKMGKPTDGRVSINQYSGRYHMIIWAVSYDTTKQFGVHTHRFERFLSFAFFSLRTSSPLT